MLFPATYLLHITSFFHRLAPDLLCVKSGMWRRENEVFIRRGLSLGLLMLTSYCFSEFFCFLRFWDVDHF